MKKILLYSFIVAGCMFHCRHLARAVDADMDSLSIDKRWKITGAYDLLTSESQLQVTFFAPDSTPARSNIKIFIERSDSIGPSTYKSLIDSIVPLYIDSTGTYTATLTPGFYTLSFVHSTWGAVCMFPIGTHFIAYKGTKMTVHFADSVYRMIEGGVRVDKPVIYLYPEKTTEVQVRLDVKGNIDFTYPTYNQGWNVIAHPNGTLETNGKNYNYLFWDAEIEQELISSDWSQGFVVHRDSLTGFFEKILQQVAFTTQEQQDFITYWVPRMIKGGWSYIHFLTDEEYSTIAKLDITPVPDQINRLFMAWCSLGNTIRTTSVLTEQTLPSFTRNGFTVVEWGGTEIKRGREK
ncbi:MAG: hypothetical protein ACHQF2_02420 [Flavobacteriales bacterium]